MCKGDEEMIKTYSLARDGNAKLSEHFTVKEFASHDGADTVLIDMLLIEYLEKIRQHFGKPVHINSARALIHTVSGSVVVEPVQLLGWEYDSANSALALTGCAGTVSNGNTLTFANAESAAFSFTVYRIVSYKAVTA